MKVFKIEVTMTTQKATKVSLHFGLIKFSMLRADPTMNIPCQEVVGPSKGRTSGGVRLGVQTPTSSHGMTGRLGYVGDFACFVPSKHCHGFGWRK